MKEVIFLQKVLFSGFLLRLSLLTIEEDLGTNLISSYIDCIPVQHIKFYKYSLLLYIVTIQLEFCIFAYSCGFQFISSKCASTHVTPLQLIRPLIIRVSIVFSDRQWLTSYFFLNKNCISCMSIFLYLQHK